MLEIRFNNSSKLKTEWQSLYCNEDLICDRVGWQYEFSGFNVEFYAKNIDVYSIIAQEYLDNITYNLRLDLFEFDLHFEFFKIGTLYKLNDKIVVEYFADFYDLEQQVWKVKTFLNKADVVLSRLENVEFTLNHNEEYFDDTNISIRILLESKNDKIENYIAESTKIMNEIYSEIRNELDGWIWKDEYYENEAVFTKDVVIPLMRKLDFKGIRYSHGINEFGKDIISFKINEFGITDYHAVQVKAGNVSGNANGSVDELISQIHDAFEIPFEIINERDKKRISKMIVAISGKFTNNAQVKIKEKVNKSLLGNIVFLDKEDIWDLLKR